MRILTLSDKIEPVLYGPTIRERVGLVDLVLAAGDVPYHYLEYVVSLLDAPLYYVHGNHDPAVRRRGEPESIDDQEARPLQWATNLHGQTNNYKGLLLAGLEGCRRYVPGRPYQYTESEVRLQAFWLSARLLLNKVRSGRFLDVMLAHAPPRGVHDAEDLAHQGFESYRWLIKWFKPVLFIHGHQHVYDRNVAVDTVLGDTQVLNTYGFRILELERYKDQGWRLLSGSR